MDGLPGHSHTFLLAVEEVVATLYAPQDVSALRDAVAALAKAASDFRPPLETAQLLQLRDAPSQQEDPVDELQRKMANVTVEQTQTAKQQPRNTQKWFNTCFGQVDQLSQKVLSELDGDAS